TSNPAARARSRKNPKPAPTLSNERPGASRRSWRTARTITPALRMLPLRDRRGVEREVVLVGVEVLQLVGPRLGGEKSAVAAAQHAMRASLAERREVATLAPAAAIGVRREHVPGHGRPDGERDRAGLRAVRAAGIVRTFCRVAGLNGWPWLMALMA